MTGCTWRDGSCLPPSIDAAATIAQIVDWARVARKDGMLALENSSRGRRPASRATACRCWSTASSRRRSREALEVEINALRGAPCARRRKIWEAAGGYAPTIGILGAVLGLIHVMENLSDPRKLGGGIAVAFVATVYGVGSANLIFLPIAQQAQGADRGSRCCSASSFDGLLGIANGENPKLIEGAARGLPRASARGATQPAPRRAASRRRAATATTSAGSSPTPTSSRCCSRSSS